MSICKLCNQEKTLDNFYISNAGHRSLKCIDCEAIRKNKIYLENKDKFKLRAKEYDKKKTAENRELIENYKSSHPCIKCGENDISCLDFHHKNPNDKKYDFGKLKKKGYATSTILIELEKCVILCCNCHRKFHAGKLEL